MYFVCVRACACVFVHWEVRREPVGVGSSYHVDPRDQIQAVLVAGTFTH